MPQTVHSAGDLPPTGADGCGVCAISTEVPGNIAQLLDCPSLNIGASVFAIPCKPLQHLIYHS